MYRSLHKDNPHHYRLETLIQTPFGMLYVACSSFVAEFLLLFYFSRLLRSQLSHVPGPPSQSWLKGDLFPIILFLRC